MRSEREPRSRRCLRFANDAFAGSAVLFDPLLGHSLLHRRHRAITRGPQILTQETKMKPNRWDTSYEWKAVTLLALGFGLVGLDRWLIAPLFPAIMKDLHLTAQDVGNCIGILGLSWGVFAALMGGISDKIGRRKVLIPAIIVF